MAVSCCRTHAKRTLLPIPDTTRQSSLWYFANGNDSPNLPLTKHQSYTVSTDPYHKVRRLDLYGHDGAPLHPMYLAYETPKILPTTTLNPLHAQAAKSKRDLSDSSSSFTMQNLIQSESLVSPERWWWFGIIATSLGGIALMYA